MIWIVFALLTCAAVLSILWPLTGPAPEPREDDADVAFYRAQIAEIDAEFLRGSIDEDQAGAARAVSARRLLASTAEAAAGDSPVARKIAAVLATLAIPIIALGLYAKIGHPNLPDLLLPARLSAPPAQKDFTAAAAKMEAQVADPSDDGHALELMTPVYLQAGRYDDAVNAIRKAIGILGETPERLAKYAEALSYANDGVVSPEALDQLERARALDPRNLLVRYYLGLAAAQHDDGQRAREIWTAMLPEMSDGTRAKQDVMEKLALLDAPVDGGPSSRGPEQGGAASPEEQRQKTIQAMVDRLARRLDARGGGAEDWARLIRAYSALGEKDKAQDAYDRARAAHSSEPASEQKLATLARELGRRP